MKLLILSDIHANWPALEAVLTEEATYDAVAFCGDVVDYGPHPRECVRWLMQHATYAVRGNHDNALAFDLECHCNKVDRAASLATRAWHRDELSAEEIQFLRDLPTLEFFEIGGRHFQMSHGTPFGNPFDYVPQKQWKERFRDLAAEFCLIGHTHIAGTAKIDSTVVVNPGSVGLSRDHGGEACYAVFDGSAVQLRRVPYDVGRTVDGLRRSPLPRDVADRLISVLHGRELSASAAG